MAVKLRLSRLGQTSKPVYRLVAIDEGKKRDGKAIEILGTYDPKNRENRIVVKKGRVDYWLSVGARPSVTVRHLLSKLGGDLKK